MREGGRGRGREGGREGGRRKGNRREKEGYRLYINYDLRGREIGEGGDRGGREEWMEYIGRVKVIEWASHPPAQHAKLPIPVCMGVRNSR